jgi:S1-C subfamily serine protease
MSPKAAELCLKANRPNMSRYQTPYSNQPVSGRRSRLPAFLLVFSVVLLAASLFRFGNRALSADSSDATPRPVASRGDLGSDEQATIELFERASQSVVYVRPLAHVVQRSLFGTREAMVEAGTGSGFIWDDAGHIVTNFHVIYDDRNGDIVAGVSVTLPDTKTYEADIIGFWPDKDIAVLKIKAAPEKLKPITIGTSADLRVGQKVVAIGNPYGLDFTLTTGVVSALNRQIQSLTGKPISEVIQTDAAINPGNSGGPLLDSAGRLIGITTAIFSQSGSSAGIGFAVPVDTVNSIVTQLIANGKVVRPGLGIIPVHDAVARRLGVRGGVLVGSVSKASGAELAGIRPTTESRDGGFTFGDIIVKIDGKATPNRQALDTVLDKFKAGDTVQVTLNRNDKEVTVPVTLQVISEDPRWMRDE